MTYSIESLFMTHWDLPGECSRKLFLRPTIRKVLFLLHNCNMPCHCFLDGNGCTSIMYFYIFKAQHVMTGTTTWPCLSCHVHFEIKEQREYQSNNSNIRFPEKYKNSRNNKNVCAQCWMHIHYRSVRKMCPGRTFYISSVLMRRITSTYFFLFGESNVKLSYVSIFPAFSF